MANFYESKPMQWVKKAGEKVVGNKGIQAISSGMMMVMGVILLGAVFQLLAVILQTIGIIDQSSGIYSALMVPYKVSMGFISLYVAFTISYSYAKSLKMQALMAGLNSILIFLIAAAPIKTVELAGEAAGTFTGMDTVALDAKGMFVAIIVALTSVQLTHFLKSIIGYQDAGCGSGISAGYLPFSDPSGSKCDYLDGIGVWLCGIDTDSASGTYYRSAGNAAGSTDKCSRNYFYRNHCQSVMDDGCPWNSGGICGNRSTVNAVLCNQLCQS